MPESRLTPGRRAVFLSYAHEDTPAAQRIADALRAAGVEVWFDRTELRGGDAWDAKIKQQIRDCALFLPVISANTNARAEGYFRLEWKLAVERSRLMADDAPFLVPVVLDDITDATARVPDRFREVQWTRLLAADAPTAFAVRVLALLTGEADTVRAAPRADSQPPTTAATKPKPVAVAVPEPPMEWRPGPDQSVPNTKWILERKLGEGGFGEVWLGRHQTMKERRVFKFCFREERVRSLKRELTLFRVLKERVGGHPNIVRLLDVHFDEPPYYVEMDYVDGQDLKSWCAQQGGVEKVPLATRLEIVAQIADALHAAHDAAVIHRDVKPGNILIAKSAAPNAQPAAKLSDFGIGQVLSGEALEGITKAGFTQSIEVGSSSPQSGTQLYMAPELLAGEPASTRTDLYSLGVVLFQLVVGDLHRPLTTDWAHAVDDPLLREDLARCFSSRPEERFASTDLLAQSLRAYEQRRVAHAREQAAAAAQRRAAQRWKVFRTVSVVALVVGLGSSLIWFLQRNAKQRWARETALPEINRLVVAGDFYSAFALARQVEKSLPDEPTLRGLWPQLSILTAIETKPPGADVYCKPYRKPDLAWQFLGKSPLKDLRLARDLYRWQIKKEGFAPVEIASTVYGRNRFSMVPVDASVPGMVRVAPGPERLASITGLQGQPSFELPSYLIDKYEVSNRRFKEFVDRGGYATASFWQHRFIKPEKELAWNEAMAEFHDTTGRPGPAAWKNGTYADGEGDFPVTGISWFEAAAYAESVGKRLPSLYHWSKAASPRIADFIVPLSNFSGRGLVRVGTYQGMSPSGAHDMAGNAKEWCWNEAGPGKRYIMGGAWREPEYMFTMPDAMSPFDRSSTNGFRCIKLLSPGAAPTGVDDSVTPPSRNYANEQPAGDEAFRIYRSLFSYDQTELDSRVEAVDAGNAHWRKEKVSFIAAYGAERMMAWVFLPKKFPPPYQGVVFFPHMGAINARSSETLGQGVENNGSGIVSLLVEHGRAVIYPIYKGTFERRDGLQSIFPMPSSSYRDHVVQWSKDLGRTIDYLVTRQDLQADKLAYFGVSWGAAMGALLPAIENRLKTSVLLVGGLYIPVTLPEVDQINFASRITIPTLMLNGRYDPVFPVESSQLPLFRTLGTPPEHKRHVIFEAGHDIYASQIAREVHDWLDRYLGPVR